ncbi:MAG: radical SAM protein [Clostridiales bacterium]|nr:radical SAM protein [Clostridiales bacterium]
MDKLTKYIGCSIPIRTCNLKCSYCYITQSNRWDDAKFEIKPKLIRKALTKKRLGGTCLINLCGAGETLIPHEALAVIRELLEEGHYVMVVTNGMLTTRFDEIITWDKELLERLLFKFSFHYAELKRINKFDVFFANVKKIKETACSFSVELMPHDEIVEDIEKIKELCMTNLGALCHVTVGRDETKREKPLLTKYSKQEFYNIWSVFESELFDFKMNTFSRKVNECCYSGKLAYFLNLQSGNLKKCYSSKVLQNVFEEIEEPLVEEIIGCDCQEAHCFNSHIFMTLGVIPELEAPYYEKLRNRKCLDGSEWIKGKFKEFISQRIEIK